jgi:hypothetical protein
MIKIARTFDTDLIYGIMTQPDLWATVAEDGQDVMSYAPDLDTECWVLMTTPEDNDPVALYVFKRVNSVMIEIHAQVLPQHRKQYSMETGRRAIEWIWANVPWCEKVIAWVPTLYPNVRDFTLANGFEIEGINTQSYRKHGKTHDQWLLGLTRGKG